MADDPQSNETAAEESAAQAPKAPVKKKRTFLPKLLTLLVSTVISAGAMELTFTVLEKRNLAKMFTGTPAAARITTRAGAGSPRRAISRRAPTSSRSPAASTRSS